MQKTQSPLWPGNYVDEIERLHLDGKTVLTAMQPEVTEALEARGLPILKVYPHPRPTAEYGIVEGEYLFQTVTRPGTPYFKVASQQ